MLWPTSPSSYRPERPISDGTRRTTNWARKITRCPSVLTVTVVVACSPESSGLHVAASDVVVIVEDGSGSISVHSVNTFGSIGNEAC